MFSNTRTMRVEWGDCDPAGIIFYVRYFDFFDVSTTMLLERALGMKKIEYLKAYDFMGHPLAETRAKFRLPTRFGDEVSIETMLVAIGRSSFKLEHRPDPCGGAGGRGHRDAGLGGPRSGRSEAHKIASDPGRGRRALDA